jgi:hypothetical protein
LADHAAGGFQVATKAVAESDQLGDEDGDGRYCQGGSAGEENGEVDLPRDGEVNKSLD